MPFDKPDFQTDDNNNLLIVSSRAPLAVRAEMLAAIKLCLAFGGDVHWDYQGLVRSIPLPVLQNLITTADDYLKRPAVAGVQKIPAHALEIDWGQTEGITPDPPAAS
jgi:ethanolamine utilization cobalamin adenosyltransferase